MLAHTQSSKVTVKAIPLLHLKRSPDNVRKVPHSQGDIETLADNIHATHMIQMPVVKTERDAGGHPTGTIW